MSGGEDRDPPDDGDDGRGDDRGNGGENGLAVAEVHPGIGQTGGRASRNIIRDDARLLDDVAPVLPTAATGRGTISKSRNPQEGELLSGCEFVMTTRVGTTLERSSGQLMRTPGSSLLTVINMRRNFRIIRRCECSSPLLPPPPRAGTFRVDLPDPGSQTEFGFKS